MSTTELKLIAETDNFHINNVKLLEYLDQARHPWYRFCIKLDVEAVVVHISADYKKEVFNQEHLNIQTTLDRLGNTSFTLKQTILNNQRELIVSAEVVLATINRKTRKKTPLPAELRELIHKTETI